MSAKTNVNYENGQKLKGFRKQNKLTQSVIAEFVGKNYRTISSWESGKIAIPNSIISKLNKKYKLNLKISESNIISNKSSVKDSIKSKTNSKTNSKNISKCNCKCNSKTNKSNCSKKSNSKIDFSSFNYVKSASISTRWTNLRKYTKLSQDSFGELFNISSSSISRYETNKKDTVSFDTLKYMVKAGINLNSFFA